MKRTSPKDEKSSTAEDSSSFSEKMSSSQTIPRNEVKKTVVFQDDTKLEPLIDAMSELREAVIDLKEEITLQHNTSSDSTVEDKEEDVLDGKRIDKIVECSQIFKQNARIYYRTRNLRVFLWIVAICVVFISYAAIRAILCSNSSLTAPAIMTHFFFVIASVSYSVYDILVIAEDAADHQKAMNESFFQAQGLCKSLDEKKNVAVTLFSTGKYHSCYGCNKKLHNKSFY